MASLTAPRGHKPEWRDRKERYLAHLCSAPDEIVLVSAANKFHNAQSIGDDHAEIGDEVFERFTTSKSDTVWYYRSLAARLGERMGEDHRLVRKLNAAISGWAPRASAETFAMYDRHGPSGQGPRRPYMGSQLLHWKCI